MNSSTYIIDIFQIFCERYFKSSSKENPGVFTRATFGFFVLKIEIRVPVDNYIEKLQLRKILGFAPLH